MSVIRKRFHVVGILGVTLLLTACSANHKSIYRTHKLSDADEVITVDAKQRSIVSNKVQVADPNVEMIRRYCAEPSPDVFSVLAQSLSAGASVEKSADPKQLQALLNFAFASSEQGSTIPRTQTINMLRELMYRTCERYLNGAYDDLEMGVQAIRDQRLMVSILAIEQLTGAVAPKPVVLGATAQGSAGASGDAIVRLDDAHKAKISAEDAVQKAQEKYDGLNTDNTCENLVEKQSNEAELSEEEKKKLKECNAAKDALAKAEKDKDKATAHYQDLKKLAQTGGVMVQTDVEHSAPGGIDRATSDAIKDVSGVVERIVAENFDNETETMMFCYKAITKSTKFEALEQEDKNWLANNCLNYLTAKVNAEEASFLDDISVIQERREERVDDKFKGLWPKIAQVISADKPLFIKQLKEVLSKVEVDKQKIPECFENAISKEGFRECFGKIGSTNRERFERAVITPLLPSEENQDDE